MIQERSYASVLGSFANGVAFALASAFLTVCALYFLGDSLAGWPKVRIMRVGIISMSLVVVSYWTYASLVWLAEDLAELQQRWRERAAT